MRLRVVAKIEIVADSPVDGGSSAMSMAGDLALSDATRYDLVKMVFPAAVDNGHYNTQIVRTSGSLTRLNLPGKFCITLCLANIYASVIWVFA